MDEPITTVSTGEIRGKIEVNINNQRFYSFQGIPYAKPPVGNLRFKAPQPAERWSGIRDATACGSECFSRHHLFKTLIGSEDCLFLNVYTPNLPKLDSKLKPVMFWIHGGGFTSGSSSSDVYGPEFLLTEDVVLVTINYRTGILGFLSLENLDLEIPGNAGLKDMVMALKWVQTNIANFSGDPSNVTIFGESAGAAASHYLILSPSAKGLFHKAILQSGCALNVWAKGTRCATSLAKVLELETNDEKEILSILQDLTVEKLFLTAEKLPDPFRANHIRPHGPVVEKSHTGAFLTEDPVDIIRSGRYNHVPFIIGFTNREGMLSEVMQRPNPFKPLADFELAVPYFLNLQRGSDKSKTLAQKIKEFYYGNEEPSVHNKDKFFLLETDNFFLRDIIQTVRGHTHTSSCPLFLYRMSLETTLNLLKRVHEITEPGVCHADDLGYLFHNLVTPELVPGSHEEIGVKRFLQLWTNFAKYGDPNPREKHPLINVQWKTVTRTTLNFLDIGEDLTVGVNPERERMTFWNGVLDINPNSKL